MSGTIKLGLILIALVLVGALVIKLAAAALSLVTPLLIIAGIGLIIYGLVSRNRALGSGRSRYLP